MFVNREVVECVKLWNESPKRSIRSPITGVIETRLVRMLEEMLHPTVTRMDQMTYKLLSVSYCC